MRIRSRERGTDRGSWSERAAVTRTGRDHDARCRCRVVLLRNLVSRAKDALDLKPDLPLSIPGRLEVSQSLLVVLTERQVYEPAVWVDRVIRGKSHLRDHEDLLRQCGPYRGSDLAYLGPVAMSRDRPLPEGTPEKRCLRRDSIPVLALMK